MRDLIYWTCPEGDCWVKINALALTKYVPILNMEPFSASVDESLIPFLPESWLADAEAAVERHEADHLGTVGE